MWVTLAPKITLNFDVIFSIIEKAKKYIRSGETPPKGVNLHTGKRGGRYYIIEDKHLKIQDKHHELVRSVGYTRDQFDDIKQKYLSQGAKSVEFIPKPEYGKKEDQKPRYNLYVNWGDKTQKKIEDKKLTDKARYGKKYDPTDLEWKQDGNSYTAPHLKSVGNAYVQVGKFRIDMMYHGGKLFFTGPDGKEQHVANAFQETFHQGTDVVNEPKSRVSNLAILQKHANLINHSGDSALHTRVSQRERLDKEKAEKPKKEYKAKNPLKSLQITLDNLRSQQNLDPDKIRVQQDEALEREKGDMHIREFVVRKLAGMFPKHSPNEIADAAIISLRSFQNRHSLSDVILSGKSRLSNIGPKTPRETLPRKSVERSPFADRMDKYFNPDPDPEVLQEKLKTLGKPVPPVQEPVPQKQARFKLVSQFTTQDAADKAATKEQNAGYDTDIKEKKIGKTTVYNVYRRKPQPNPVITVPHGDAPGQNGWVRKVTGYNPEWNLNKGELIEHDSFENGQKKFTLEDGLYESATGTKYHTGGPKQFYVENGVVHEIDRNEYLTRLRNLPYVTGKDAILQYQSTKKESAPEPEPFNSARYAGDPAYRKQIDASIGSKNPYIKASTEMANKANMANKPQKLRTWYITGNTFDNRDDLKGAGAMWDQANKRWVVHEYLNPRLNLSEKSMNRIKNLPGIKVSEPVPRLPSQNEIEEYNNKVENITIRKGGAGSGNFDHSGRPGEVGGSGGGSGKRGGGDMVSRRYKSIVTRMSEIEKKYEDLNIEQEKLNNEYEGDDDKYNERSDQIRKEAETLIDEHIELGEDLIGISSDVIESWENTEDRSLGKQAPPPAKTGDAEIDGHLSTMQEAYSKMIELDSDCVDEAVVSRIKRNERIYYKHERQLNRVIRSRVAAADKRIAKINNKYDGGLI
jgi:hypothetical protein